MTQRTLSIIKPDAVGMGRIGEIIALLEKGNLAIRAARMMRLTPAQARAFYSVHSQRPFFASLVDFMTSGPVVVMVLEGEDAIDANRRIMGATDPAKAAAGTIRALLGTDIQNNAVHGSDSPETAAREIAFFFGEADLVQP